MMKYRCNVCGNRFEEPEESSCKNCPLSGNCELIKCPNCGYEFLPVGD